MIETKKLVEARKRYTVREKELQDFLSERGDNITKEDYTKMTAIRDDLNTIAGEIEFEKSVSDLKADATRLHDFHTKPTPGMRHQAVIGSTKSGHTDLAVGRRGKGDNRTLRLLRSKGPGIFGQKTFEGIADPGYQRAFAEYMRKGERLKGVHRRTLEVGLDPQGGSLAPIEMIARLIERKPTPSNVQDLCDFVNSSRDAISLPRVNYQSASDDSTGSIYTTGFRATLTDELPTSDTQANVTDTNLFGSVRVQNYTWLIEGALSVNMVEDALFDPITWMNGKFVETVRLLRDNVIINGTGIGQPAGILVNPYAGSSGGVGGTDVLQPQIVVTGAASTILPDSLISISEDVPEQYDDNCRFLFKKTTTGKQIRQLKDSQNRYLFGEGYQDSGLVVGRKRMLNGYPTVFSQFMPDPGASTNPAIFGDFGGVTVVNRVGFSIQILREIAARRNLVIILGRVRFGVQVLEPWRLRVLQCHT